MRSANTAELPAPPTWSPADLVNLTIRLANDPARRLADDPARRLADDPARRLADDPARRPPAPPTAGPAAQPAAALPNLVAPNLVAPVPDPADMGPLTGRVADRGPGVPRLSTGPDDRSPDRPLAVPLLVTAEVEAWLLAWPAGLVTPAHDHGGAGVAVTVVDGSLSEECLDLTIWTTGRRTTWRAGASTLFPAGHVHLLGAAGDRPAVAVHAWNRPAGSADRAAGRLAPGRGALAALGPGRAGHAAQPVGVGPGRGRDACLAGAGQPAHGALDLGHVRDRVAG
jgi:quercetin dioxygenase-like cupin family protein